MSVYFMYQNVKNQGIRMQYQTVNRVKKVPYF